MTVNPDKQFTITTEALGACGAVSYWRASGEVSIEAVKAAWTAAGLDPEKFRKIPEPETALRRAVQAQQDRHRLVRPLKEQHAWAIVDEEVFEGKPPAYRTQAIVRFDAASSTGFRLESHGANAAVVGEIINAVATAYAVQQGTFQPEDITSWLVKLAYGANAVTLRDSGGVYFIPKPAMEFWNKAAGVIESASRGSHKVFRIPAMRNSEAIEAIIDAVTAEAEQVARKIDEEISAGLASRALETRKGVVAELLAKVSSYEELVGQQMKVRERLETLQAAVATAQLVASAPVEEAA